MRERERKNERVKERMREREENLIKFQVVFFIMAPPPTGCTEVENSWAVQETVSLSKI